MPLDELQTVKFGWLKAWGRYDHLVLVGFNKGAGQYFVLNQRKVNAFVKSHGYTWPNNEPAVLQAKSLFRSLDPNNYLEAKLAYCGTLEISETAKSFRHFVFVTVRGMEDEMKDEYGYCVLDTNDLESTTGHFHVRAVEYLVTEHSAGRLLV